MNFHRETVRLDGMDFEVIRAGNGSRLLLFLHGFPDYAGSMKELMSQFDPDTHTLIAPFMRGYHPTDPAPEDHYLIQDLARDAIGLVDHYDPESAWVIGHDWGAMAAYASAVLDSKNIDGISIISVPPIPVLFENVVDCPSQFLRSWYMFFFQFPWLPEKVIKLNDYYLVEWFWNNWSPDKKFSPNHVEAVKDLFATEGTSENAIRYYRGFIWDLFLIPSDYFENHQIMFTEIEQPCLALVGENDGCITTDLFRGVTDFLGNDSQFDTIPGAGHFLPQEAPGEVADRLKEFIQQD